MHSLQSVTFTEVKNTNSKSSAFPEDDALSEYLFSMIMIGIDPGKITGIGITIGQDKQAISMPIHKALQFVEDLTHEDKIHVRVEDARKRKWFGKNSVAKKQGAGSIKRDSTIWNDFLKDLQKKSNGLLTFEMLHPIKGATKIAAAPFKKLTGIQKQTNEHGRDAFMLIINFKPISL